VTVSAAPGPAAASAAIGPIVITRAIDADAARWDAYVRSRFQQASTPDYQPAGYHLWSWRGVFERAFGHTSVYLVARAGTGAGHDDIVGILPLTEIKSWLFGRSLTSLPFVNYGGVIADSPAVARALVDEAGVVARERDARHVELRHVARQFDDLPCKTHKVTMVRRLEPSLWDALDRKVRNQVRKAQKSDLTTAGGGAELVDEFYAVFARNMRDLGTPVYSKRLFVEVLAAFPETARLTVVRLGAKPIAAALTYQSAATIEVPWASSIRDFNTLCPNHLLYWTIMEQAAAAGVARMDFGRSTPHEGTYKFKEQWGAEPIALHWEYAGVAEAGVPDQTTNNPKFQLAIETWKRLPLWAANAAGPRIVKRIP
jgi:FemAB-related protein (PEP-CTERM system-associated)